MMRWLTVAGAVLILGLVGWRLTQKQAQAAEDKQRSAAMRSAPTLVQITPVTRQDVVKTFEAVASIEAPLAVEVGAEAAGRIAFLNVREGDQVRAGQVLARIDTPELEAAVRRSESALAAAKARLAEASLTESSRGVGVNSTIRQQRSQLNSAIALEKKARADLDEQIAAAEADVIAADGRIREAEAQIARAEAAIVSVKANVENVRTFLGRQQTLLDKGFVSKQIVDNARTTLAVQEAEVNRAEQDRRAAIATRDAAVAQKQAAVRQVALVKNKANAEVLSAGSTVAQVRAGLEAAQANTAQTTAYTQNLAALRANVGAAEADLRAARNRLEDAIVRSPLTGTVTRRALDPGALVSINQTILSLQTLGSVWATVSIPEEVSRRLSQGQPATVTIDALPGVKFFGRIAQILPAADAQSRQFTARISLDNRDNRIRPGTFGRVTFVTERAPNALVAPLEAVKEDPARPGVQTITVVEGDKARVREVRTGLSNGKIVALESGVKEGEPLVILTSRNIKDGQPVKVGGAQNGAQEGGRRL